ncbi:MAG: bifunctional riboflavin kinase/FAD synthetase [Bacteroidetes bacterium]|nr:bifunctional riboflavin kinase/FAD synthetase [Bacteroidota bacterium]
MNVHTNIDQLPVFKNAVITIGTFDGVHQGHKQIISQLVKEAHAINGTSVVITFDPHPKKIVGDTQNPVSLLNSPAEKYQLLQKAGIGHIVVVPFTKEFAEQPASSYIRDFLVAKFHPHTIIIGYDHRFGKDRAGDYHLLEAEALRFGYIVKEIPEHVLQDVTISSTRIRKALVSGDIDTANKFLGYEYFFSGIVTEGNKLGRTIGYPTANLSLTDSNKLIPANGVYAVKVGVEGFNETFGGMMNIGTRPTVDGSKLVIEVNIFDFDEMIYGKKVTVMLIKKLREEVKFSGLEALKEQLGKDREDALRILEG